MIIVITGPTGVGKTKLSIELAKLLKGEIINADSTQIYKNMNIGTAKITKEEMENIPHHLLDIKDVSENYSVCDYQRDGRIIIEEIKKRGSIPIIVGGTALYIKALLYDYRFDYIEKEYNLDNYSSEILYEKIHDKTNLDIKNRRRLERRFIYQKNHFEDFKDNNKGDILLYKDTIFIGLKTDRKNLYNKINQRVDKMISEGLLDEVKKFYDKNIHSKAMNAIGYRDLYNYFDKIISLEEAIDIIKKKSRNYAKRQLTFMNNKLDITWFETDYENFNKTVDEIYNYIKKED